jgi:hypothetical protein
MVTTSKATIPSVFSLFNDDDDVEDETPKPPFQSRAGIRRSPGPLPRNLQKLYYQSQLKIDPTPTEQNAFDSHVSAEKKRNDNSNFQRPSSKQSKKQRLETPNEDPSHDSTNGVNDNDNDPRSGTPTKTQIVSTAIHL